MDGSERLIKAANSSFFEKGIKVPLCLTIRGKEIITVRGDEKFTYNIKTMNTNSGISRSETLGEKVEGSRRKQPRYMEKVLNKRLRTMRSGRK
jgi:hypothetical protein